MNLTTRKIPTKKERFNLKNLKRQLICSIDMRLNEILNFIKT